MQLRDVKMRVALLYNQITQLKKSFKEIKFRQKDEI